MRSRVKFIIMNEKAYLEHLKEIHGSKEALKINYKESNYEKHKIC